MKRDPRRGWLKGWLATTTMSRASTRGLCRAKIAEHDGDTDRADDLYVRALTGLDRAGCYTAYADTALGYSLVLRQRGETERALEYAVQAAQTKAARAT